jgi:hypothetical protein
MLGDTENFNFIYKGKNYNMTKVIFTGIFLGVYSSEITKFEYLVVGKEYFINGNKLSDRDRTFLINITGEEAVNCFKLAL